MGVDGATPSADAADIAISAEPGVTQMYQLLIQRADADRDRRKSKRAPGEIPRVRDRTMGGISECSNERVHSTQETRVTAVGSTPCRLRGSRPPQPLCHAGHSATAGGVRYVV